MAKARDTYSVWEGYNSAEYAHRIEYAVRAVEIELYSISF